jgi:hypothetical protein
MSDEIRSPTSPSADPVARYFPWVAWVVLALSLLKGLRMPNLWSATHFAFNYSQGFIRRGLIGEAARRLLGERAYHYNVFAVAAIVIFGAMVGEFVWLIRRTLRVQGAAGELGISVAILAFVASPGITFFAHIIGYFDILGLLVLLGLVVYSTGARQRYWLFYLSALAGVLLAFVHEGMVIMFVPTMFFMLLCYVIRLQHQGVIGRGARWSLYIHTALATFAGIAASSIISHVGTRDSATISALHSSIGQLANFQLRTDGFEVLYHSVQDELLNVMPAHWRHEDRMVGLQRGFVAIAPGFLFLVYYGIRCIARWNTGWRTRALLGTSYLGAVLSPLSLNLVGWDNNRWNAISMIAAMCCICIMRLHLLPSAKAGQAQRWALSPRELTAGICVVAIGLATTNDLFDGYAVQWFPFGHHVDSIRELFESHFTWRPRS